MTTSFTFRDFLVYLMTGVALSLTIGLVFREILFELTIEFFRKYEFINDFSFLASIFLVPFLYLAGHLVNTLDFLTLKYFVWLHKKLRASRWFGWFRKLNELLFYRHRIAYSIVKYWKSVQQDKAFSSTEEFWTLCAKLQKEKVYDNAGYWYILNDLFKAVNIVFILGAILATIQKEWALLFLFAILSIFSYLRAMQFAKFFVDTVIRLAR